MDIFRNGLYVGTLNDDGGILTEDPELLEFALALKTHGMTVMVNKPDDNDLNGEDVCDDWGEVRFPSEENLDLVVDTLREVGYTVGISGSSLAR
jgi:hypothetical protein